MPNWVMVINGKPFARDAFFKLIHETRLDIVYSKESDRHYVWFGDTLAV